MSSALVPTKKRGVKLSETDIPEVDSDNRAVVGGAARRGLNEVLKEAKARGGVRREFGVLEILKGEVGTKYILDPAWQRVRREKHILNITAGLRAHGFTSPLVLAEKDGVFLVVDGCHRMTAIEQVLQDPDVPSFGIGAEIYFGLTDEEMRELFFLLNSISKSNLSDLISSYREDSPAFRKYGDGTGYGLGMRLTFSNNRGVKEAGTINYANCLAAAYCVKQQLEQHSRNTKSLVRFWRSEEAVLALLRVFNLIRELNQAGLRHSYYHGSCFLQVLLELVEANGGALIQDRLWKLGETKDLLGVLRRQTSSQLPLIRLQMLKAMNRDNKPTSQVVKCPRYVVDAGGLVYGG